jgi:GrpB-like predicted nucleotidyltransferase (UPF0157 family)
VRPAGEGRQNAAMRVAVAPYDPRWRADFERVRRDLATALGHVPVAAIEHVGSTAVPGLAAKPIIDVDVVVQRSHLAAAIAALRSAGYAYEGERGVPDRHAFTAPDERPRRHVYVCLAGSLALRNHLAVRDVLRADDELRAEYAAVKAALAARDLTTMDDYVAAKSRVLRKILAAAGLSAKELDAVAATNPGPPSGRGGEGGPTRGSSRHLT